MIKFGPAGQSASFEKQGFRHSYEMPEWLSKMNLTAYEYQCNKGVKIREQSARKVGENAKEFGIALSIHGPYYISLSSVEEEKRENSIKYITDTMQVAKWMGATRVVIHSGSAAKQNRIEALQKAKEVLAKTLQVADDLGFGSIHICPELMGKENQLGNLDEVMELCGIDERLIPCIDFGHLNAREQGAMQTKEDFLKVLDIMEDTLGFERIKNFHVHYSRIEFTGKGEKCHWTYADTLYGPDFDPFAEAILQRGIEPVIICESRGTQAEDAATFLSIYDKLKVGSCI